MNYKEIKELIDLISGTDLTEIEVERGGTRIRLCRECKGAPRVEVREIAVSAPAARKEEKDTRQEVGPAVGEVPLEGIVKSPLVGTFYRAAGPDSKVYAEVGETVVKGQVLCIVEAMKLMNEIESEFTGTVREIFVENSQPVEYGQPLFRIEPGQ